MIWEIVLDQEGDPEAEGFLTLSFGCGAALEDAVKNSEDWIELCWLEELETEPFQIPADAVSWAAVEKHRDLEDASNGIMLLAADVELLDGQENGEGRDLPKILPAVTVSRWRMASGNPVRNLQTGTLCGWRSTTPSLPILWVQTIRRFITSCRTGSGCPRRSRVPCTTARLRWVATSSVRTA